MTDYDTWKLATPPYCEPDPHEDERDYWEKVKEGLRLAIDAFASGCRIYSESVPDVDQEIVAEIKSMQEAIGDISGEFE